jgi:protein phosphatase
MTDLRNLDTAEFKVLFRPTTTSARAEPPSAAVEVEFGAVTHPGRVRPRNEDHYLISRIRREQDILATNVPDNLFPRPIEDDAYLMSVADGMGGMAAGQIASRLAIGTGVRLLHRSPKWGFKIDEKEAKELVQRALEYFREIDRTLTDSALDDRRLFGMGTTLTAAYSIGVNLFLMHAGDSRAYLLRKGQLTQLTHDHTVAQALADAGQIPPEEVRTHSRRNILTNFLGGHHGKVQADVRWLRLLDGDRILLCSDGLTEMLDDAQIERTLSCICGSAEAAQALLDQALECGGRDNVTVIVARYTIPTREEAKRRHDQSESQDEEPTTIETLLPEISASTAPGDSRILPSLPEEAARM